jgi:hypothetical protein
VSVGVSGGRAPVGGLVLLDIGICRKEPPGFQRLKRMTICTKFHEISRLRATSLWMEIAGEITSDEL